MNAFWGGLIREEFRRGWEYEIESWGVTCGRHGMGQVYFLYHYKISELLLPAKH